MTLSSLLRSSGKQVPSGIRQSSRSASHNQRSFCSTSDILARDAGAPTKSAPQLGVKELRSVPGIGASNERKLRESELKICSVNELRQLFQRKYCRNAGDLQKFFHAIGIYKHHASAISDFLGGNHETTMQSHKQKQVTLCVEGNISVGKSTFLQEVCGAGDVQVVAEPISRWRNLPPDRSRSHALEGTNMLDLFYSDPKAYAYIFQNYVTTTRMAQVCERRQKMDELTRSDGHDEGDRHYPLKILERSVFSDQMVFVKEMHRSGCMTDLELDVYTECAKILSNSLPQLTPTGFVYLRAAPETCHQRKVGRGRAEECAVTIDYLQELHQNHRSWMEDGSTVRHGTDIPDDLKGLIHQLDGSAGHVPEVIHGVPTLILDCDERDFSLGGEQEHRDFYSSKVRQFHTHLAMTDDASDDNGQARLRAELNREDLVRIIQELSQIVASKADDTRKVEGVTEVLSRQLVNVHALQLDVLEKDMIL